MALTVQKVYQVDRNTLGIDWNDGTSGRWRLAHLRRNCPCAGCVDEWTRERTLDVATVDEDLLATAVESVGRYALRVRFADGHDTGIYSFELLRELDQSTR
jgi:DUF971 family protein